MTSPCPHNCRFDREAAMTVVARDATGKPTVWCDPCIADVVAALNAAGIETVASCCGHRSPVPGCISLADGRWFVLLPSYESWQAAMALLVKPGVTINDEPQVCA